MTPEPKSLRRAREDVIDGLCRRFAEDELSLGELERRLEKVRAARSSDELDALVSDLKPRRSPVTAGAARPGRRPPARSDGRAPASRAAPVSGAPSSVAATRPSAPGIGRSWSHLALAVMGGARRAGRWSPPRSMVAVALMGGVELDFRSAVFTGGVVEINCFAFWGAVEITVPPNVHVDARGFAVMGGFDQVSELDTDPGPGAPTIRINGFALMGAVDVNVVARE